MSDIEIRKVRNLKTSAYCPHCHQYTLITVVENNIELYGRVFSKCAYKSKFPGQIWWIGECHSCNRVVLVLNNGNMIYPRSEPQSSDDRIPEIVRSSLDEAKRCFMVEAYCGSVTMSRKALQACCIEQGATYNENLNIQINELFEKGVITKPQKEWADTIRWLGNDGAHITPNQITREDADDILSLAIEIFKNVYISPAIAQERLEKRKMAREEKKDE